LGDANPSMPPAPGAAPAPAIDFHFNVDHRVNYACRVVRKAHAAGRSVLVYSQDAERLARMDNALWTFSLLDFLPHVCLPSPLAPRTPIWLCSQAVPEARDVLLLLDDAPAPSFAQWFPHFGRVIDVVSTDAAERSLARTRFKTYRDAGFTPVAHDLGSVPA